MGRPSKYSPELADEICSAIASSDEGLDAICSELKIGSTTVYNWLIQREEFREKYAHARELQQQVFVDQLITLADRDRICRKVTTKADGSIETVVVDQVERSKLQIETRKWLLSKLNPKKYGDKLQNEHTGDNGGPIRIIADL